MLKISRVGFCVGDSEMLAWARLATRAKCVWNWLVTQGRSAGMGERTDPGLEDETPLGFSEGEFLVCFEESPKGERLCRP
ncbi:MAG: hypothetical protein JWR26_4352 [Pedosphaera sp.]|nr:hypothetical protein [Pedosphaera sp.]